MFTVFTIALVSSLPICAETEYQAQREALFDKAISDDELDGEYHMMMIFDKTTLFSDPCELAAGIPEFEGMECDAEILVLIEGISDQGRATLTSAINAYEYFQLDLLDEEARLLVEFCETGESNSKKISQKISDIRESVFDMHVGFFDQVVTELDEIDAELFLLRSEEVFGVRRPQLSPLYREAETQIAGLFPNEYLQTHVELCTDAIEYKGKPFRKFRRYRSGENCEHCWELEYIAQEREQPGDVEMVER